MLLQENLTFQEAFLVFRKHLKTNICRGTDWGIVTWKLWKRQAALTYGPKKWTVEKVAYLAWNVFLSPPKLLDKLTPVSLLWGGKTKAPNYVLQTSRCLMYPHPSFWRAKHRTGHLNKPQMIYIRFGEL